MSTKYEVSMSNPVARGVCTDANDTNDDDEQQTMHDCIGSLVDKPNEPKSTKMVQNGSHLNLSQNHYIY